MIKRLKRWWCRSNASHGDHLREWVKFRERWSTDVNLEDIPSKEIEQFPTLCDEILLRQRVQVALIKLECLNNLCSYPQPLTNLKAHVREFVYNGLSQHYNYNANEIRKIAKHRYCFKRLIQRARLTDGFSPEILEAHVKQSSFLNGVYPRLKRNDFRVY